MEKKTTLLSATANISFLGTAFQSTRRRSYRGHVLPESAVFSYVTSVSSAMPRTRDIPAGFYSMRELMRWYGSPVLSACDITLHFRGEIAGSAISRSRYSEKNSCKNLSII